MTFKIVSARTYVIQLYYQKIEIEIKIFLKATQCCYLAVSVIIAKSNSKLFVAYSDEFIWLKDVFFSKDLYFFEPKYCQIKI